MSEQATIGAGGMQRVPVETLPVQQLDQIKKDVDQEINVITETVNQLKVAQTKLAESAENLQHIIATNEGTFFQH